MKKGLPILERLALSARREPNGCLVWTGYRHPDGYGQVRSRKVHRLAWEAVNGPIPAGMSVCHHCDNRPCFEVAHLFLGTQADNNADCIAKGRHRASAGEANGRAVLTAEQVASIKNDGRSQVRIAADYGIKQPQVSRIKRGESWAHA